MNELLKRAFIPSLGDFIYAIVFLFLLRLLPSMLYNDGGTGWHLATGRFIAETGKIPYNDFMSFTFPGEPWVSQYWLFDAVMYWFQHALGYNGLSVFFATGFGGLFLWVYHACRKEGANCLLVFAMVFVAAICSSIQFLARPIIVTWLMVFLFGLVLDRFQNDKLTTKQLIFILSVSSLFWANCHPGFIIGLVMVAIYLCWNLIPSLFHSSSQQRRSAVTKSVALGTALFGSFIATLVNPYGIELHIDLVQDLVDGSKNSLIDSVDEFRSPSFHGGIQAKALELLLLGTLVAPAMSLLRPCVARCTLVIAFAHLTLYAVRNAPLFALVTVPFIAQLMSQTRLPELLGNRTTTESPPLLRRLLDAVLTSCKRMDQQEVLNGFHLLPIGLTILFFALSANGNNQILNSKFSEHSFPTTTLQSIKQLNLAPREGFNEANWGGYIFYETGVPVYIDDRASFFANFYVHYGEIVSLLPGWREKLKQDGINWILIRKNTDFANAIRQDSDWKIASEDNAAYLFVRNKRVPAAAKFQR
ncbi:MAG: hypothetical protein K2W95_17895 [Candidatus Obscuribacterales bacterium]|nr:hypothetical protein [Candidatus Obscuribacterales bacterium]